MTMADLAVCGCGHGHRHLAGAAMCYVCDLPLCQHPGDGCPLDCGCGCEECEALQARLRGDEDGSDDRLR